MCVCERDRVCVFVRKQSCVRETAYASVSTTHVGVCNTYVRVNTHVCVYTHTQKVRTYKRHTHT